jgi:hypothetical protein
MYIPLYIVNDKSEYVVVNDQWNSLQLQQFIADKFDIAVDDQIIYFRGKPLFGEVSGNLKDNGVSEGNNIFVSKKLRGGSASKGISIAMTVLTIILLVLFCVTMIIGVVPVWAHVFGCYIKKGICWLFGTALNEGGFIGMLLRYTMYAITFFIVGIFVYSLTGVAFFMLLFNKKQHFCSSMVIARYIALTLTAIFIIIYALFALPDFAGQIGLHAQNNSPIFVGAILTPLLNAVEWLADTGKFMIFYIIPIFGELLLSEQDVTSRTVKFLYTFFGEMKDIGCEKKEFDIALIGMLEYFETDVGCTFVQDNNLKRVIELIFYTFEDEIRKVTNNGEWKLDKIANMSPEAVLKEGRLNSDQHAMAKKLHAKMEKQKFSKTKDMEKYTKKQSNGTKEKKKVNICEVYSTLRDHNKLKWQNYNYDMNMWNDNDVAKKKYEEDNPMPLDPITKAALPFSKNLICSIFQLFPTMNKILNCCIGRPYVMGNMIENSQIAGVLTTIATLVIIILTYVLSSMYGYKM